MPKDQLTCKELLFIDAYFLLGQNATRAYQKVWGCKANSARASAPRILAKASVQAEIAKRVRYDAGITRELVESNLLHALSLANESKDAAIIASVTMDCAKLAGLLVDKKEVVTVSDQDRQQVARLAHATLSAN